MSDTVTLYTIRTAPFGSGNWLHEGEDTDVHGFVDEVVGSTECGRMDVAPHELEMSAELEGAEEDYGEDEIAESMRGVPLPYMAFGRGVLVGDAFVVALEQVGAAFRAHAVILIHPATDRRWAHWLVTFVHDRHLPHLRDDDEPVVFDRQSSSVAYYNQAARDAIAALGWTWMTFTKHEFRRCKATPIGDTREADRELVAAIGAMFIAKRPRAKVENAYAASYFVDRLLARYSDATLERVGVAIERTPDASIHATRRGGLLDAIAVRADSPLGRRLEKP